MKDKVGMNQKKENNKIPIENLDEQREYIQKNVNRILTNLPKRNIRLENRLIDHFLNNCDEIDDFINNEIDSEQINNLIKRAKNDVKRADEAYKDKDFNNTVYFVQQSTEKIVKAYGLFLGILNDPRKDMGHEPIKFYIKMLNKSWVEKIPDVLNIDSKSSIEYLEILKNKHKAKLELDDSIPFLLNLFNDVLKNANKELSKREMKQVLLALKNFNGLNLKKFLITQIYFSYFICPFAIISSAHENIPRYSDDIPDLKIISNYPKISKNIKNSLTYVEKDIGLSKLKDL